MLGKRGGIGIVVAPGCGSFAGGGGATDWKSPLAIGGRERPSLTIASIRSRVSAVAQGASAATKSGTDW